jgi:hypothetical protein
MLTGLYAKLIGLGLTLAALVGLFAWGHHVGAVGVQKRWDAAKTGQAVVAERATVAHLAQALDWNQRFATIATHYEATSHAPTPAVADSVAAAAAAGTLRLRDRTDVCPRGVPAATAAARATDAAATAALAQRVTDSIAAIRVGDAADARERQLDEQVTALQALLRAERTPASPTTTLPAR